MGFLDSVKKLVGQNADKVDAAIDKVGDVVDSKTGDKYKGIVDSAQSAAKKAVDGTKTDGQLQGEQVPPTQQSGQVPPASPPPSQ
jgi:acyl-CoA reductase-like NAD-dependent aldehyde dehydrogenase